MLGERRGKVPEVGGRVEANQIGAQQPAKQPVPRRQGAEQLLRGKRDVKEEADPGVRAAAARSRLRQQQQLVIVHPDQVARLVVLRHDVGEPLVHLDVGVPVADVERNLIQEVVEQRPEHPVGEPLVVPGDLIGGEGHRHQPHGGELLVELRTVGRLISSLGAPDHPIQSPPDCSCGRRSPVASPPGLRWTSTPLSVARR